jgi:hypothetical protein
MNQPLPEPLTPRQIIDGPLPRDNGATYFI